ncbi:phosphoadenosine phosphosulfate reductase family protein [Methylophilus sp. YYY-1]|uniref:phosphoadenosine phosphosulfate reductase family protein n=1 Tax=Methylophilus sp. YYY-1 TaxID=2682087 RepID=UPI0023B31AEB|nr:phosphoadenosine phosphosulfate reductase family protein [Methylophilus sp. YYY-1]MDF0379003.1 phosphoadenosine phosphosulfate reductase family protein [Methylophilus sp. YYY-1]
MTERHVLGISGGKDSAALAIYMRMHHPELNIEYFFTDTGKELPEVYEFLSKLEGFLGQPILRLNPTRGFDFWLKQFNHFLPSPRARWCTRQLKLLPFEQWVKPMLEAGEQVTSYVAIRSDEDYREGYSAKHPNLKVELPFRKNGIDKAGVSDILSGSGVGWPTYYDWRSRSGCTFCFFQQKIEWVRLKENHPELFEEAKKYEKVALEHGSPFTWSQNESLTELEKPKRVIQIINDFEVRKARNKANRSINPLRPNPPEDIDELYGVDEGGGACAICHK